MNKKMIFRLLFIFIFSLLVYLVFGFNVDNGDGFANFGFSYGLIKGGIPYLDFNTISTPLYMFYQAIFLLISNQYIMFIIAACLTTLHAQIKRQTAPPWFLLTFTPPPCQR